MNKTIKLLMKILLLSGIISVTSCEIQSLFTDAIAQKNYLEIEAELPLFSLTYDKNGGIGTVPVGGIFKSGKHITVSDTTGFLEKTGYSFLGWNTSSDGRGTTYIKDQVLELLADTTLYALWAPNPGAQTPFSVDGVIFNMHWVPGGYDFPMGIDDDIVANVANDYLVAETDLTYELWKTVYDWADAGTISGGGSLGEDSYVFQNPGRQGTDGNTTGLPIGTPQQPVTAVSWRDAIVWCNALTEMINAETGQVLTCAYKVGGVPIRNSTDSNAPDCDGVIVDASATGFRLLTNKEFALASRWRNNATFTVPGYSDPWFTKGVGASGSVSDSEDDKNVVSYWGSTTGEVKADVAPNSLGLYNMTGNIKNWLEDKNPSTNTRLVADSFYRHNFPYYIALKNYNIPNDAYYWHGIRIAMNYNGN